MKVTDLGKVSPQHFQNLRDEFTEATEDQLVVCQLDSPAVFMGHSSDEASVVHSDYCHEHKVPVLRSKMRHGVSGYHDKNEFRFCAVITRASRPLTASQGHRLLAQVTIETLNACNVSARCTGNNIFVGDKKIGSFSAYVFNLAKVIVLSGHILLDWDIDTAEQAITSPRHNMREHVRGLKELGYEITFDKMRDAFITAWDAIFGDA